MDALSPGAGAGCRCAGMVSKRDPSCWAAEGAEFIWERVRDGGGEERERTSAKPVYIFGRLDELEPPGRWEPAAVQATDLPFSEEI